MILNLYAGMLRAGIPMREIDETDLGRYLRVMGHMARQREDEPAPRAQNTGKGKVIELRRGTIDQVWG